MAIQLPASLRRVKPLTPRAAILGVIGLEYLLFAPFYAYVLQWCHDTVGDPHRAALAHYEGTAPAQVRAEPRVETLTGSTRRRVERKPGQGAQAGAQCRRLVVVW